MQKEQKDSSELVFMDKPLNEFLNKEDFDYFKKLKKTLSSHICRNCRNRRVESFSDILSATRYFIERTKEDAWKRSLICGVCWYNNYFCVNIRQMSEFLEKCKSSINGSLQRLSLMVIQNKQQTYKILTEAIPYLKNHQEIRKMWSVRQFILSPQNYAPPIVPPLISIQQPTKHRAKRTNTPSSKSSRQTKNSQNQNAHIIQKNIETESQPTDKNNDAEKGSKDNMELFKEINSLEEIFD